jgi:hypothetical protein
MSILSDAYAAAAGQRRLEFAPTAAREENHRSGQRAAILALLRLGPMTAVELFQVAGSGFSSRLFELREQGHRIKTRMVARHGVYELEEP